MVNPMRTTAPFHYCRGANAHVQKFKIALEFSWEWLYDYMMTNGGKSIICLLASLSICASSRAVTPDSSDNPYHGIVDRNVFGLKPPPPPPDPEANKPPPPKIVLAGIMGGFGAKKALMKTTPPAKPGEPAKEQSYILAVGQREDDLEVLDINEKAGSVKVKYGGVEVPLTFDNNGVKFAAGPPPAVAPAGGVPPPGGGAAPGGANPFAPNASGFNKTIPTRPMRPSGANGGITPQSTGGAYPGATPYTAGNGIAVPTPGLTVAPGQSIPPTAQQQQQPELTGEQATVLLELERERLKQQGSPIHDLMPPTELSPGANTIQNQNQTPGATTPGTTTTTPGLPIPGPRRPGGPFPQ
jgi:hypothetical protein